MAETQGQRMSRIIREHAGHTAPAEQDQAAEPTDEPIGNADFDGGARTTGPQPTDMNQQIRRAAGF